MADHRRVPGARRLVRIVGRRHAFAQVAAAVVGAVVLDAAAAHLGLQRIGQRRPGGLHAEHPGVAAGRRHFQRIEHRGVGRRRQIAHVGVPDGLARAERADRRAFVVEHVRDDVDVRIAFGRLAAVLLDRRRIELAEAAREGQQVVVGQLLVAEEQGAVAIPGLLDLGEFRVVHAAPDRRRKSPRRPRV